MDRIARSPRWSPDSREIAFFSTQAGQREIYVIDLAKGKTRRLTINPANDDGTKLVPGRQVDLFRVRTATVKAGFGKCPLQAVKRSK